MLTMLRVACAGRTAPRNWLMIVSSRPTSLRATRTDSSSSSLAAFSPSAAQVALEELEMDVERVERIAQLVRDAGGQQRDGVDFLRLDRFAGLRAARGQVVEDEGEAHQRRVLVLQRDEIKIQVARLRIEDLQVAADHAALGENFGPVEFLEMLRHGGAHRLGRIDPEQPGDGVVEVADFSLRIDHHDPFLQGVEDRLEKALFLVEPLQISLQVALTRPGRSG